MRWLKFTAAGKTSWGIVEGDSVIAVNGDPFGEWQRGTPSHALKDVKIRVVAVGQPRELLTTLTVAGYLLPGATPATPTRNTTVPAANKKPMNRTRKRIIEVPFQPVRRYLRRLS